MNINVLVLDANQRSALATTRSLGKQGITVFTCDETDQSLSGQSRYSTKYLKAPSAAHQSTEFLDALRNFIGIYNIGMILPMTDITCPIILENRRLFDDILIPLPTYEQYKQVTSKTHLFRHASKLGINIPKTLYINKYNDLDAIAALNFPVVIKPSLSRIKISNKWINTSVKYAHSLRELRSIVNSFSWFPDIPFMIQEFIEGHGAGVFALYNHGKPVTFFSHKRLREKPPSGGVSVLSESTNVNSNYQEIAQLLLGRIGWHGAAMVELKITEDGAPYLIEINARFWGSLQLAIDSGIDFPWLLYQIAIGQNPESIPQYRSGQRLRWLLGDMDRLYLIYKNRKSNNTYSALVEMIKFLNPGFIHTRFDICRLRDPGPGVYEITQYIKQITRK